MPKSHISTVCDKVKILAIPIYMKTTIMQCIVVQKFF